MRKNRFLKSNLLIGLGAASVASVAALTAVSCATTTASEIHNSNLEFVSSTETNRVSLTVFGYKLPLTLDGWDVKSKDTDGGTYTTYTSENLKYEPASEGNIYSGTFTLDRQDTLNKIFSFAIKGSSASIEVKGPEAVVVNKENIGQVVNQNKVEVTFTGKNFPTDPNNYEVKESTTSGDGETTIDDTTTTSSWTIKGTPTKTSVTFEAGLETVNGKKYTLTIKKDGFDDETIDFTVDTKSEITSEIQTGIDEKGLSITFSGTNLSTISSYYEISEVKQAESPEQPSLIDESNEGSGDVSTTILDSSKYNVEVSNNSATISFPKSEEIGKLYGKEYQIKLKDSNAEAKSFTFDDYVAPTGINKEKFFTTVKEGASAEELTENKDNIKIEEIDGSKLKYLITTSDVTKEHIEITLPTENIFDFLEGTIGYSQETSKTTLAWKIEETNSNFKLDDGNKLTNGDSYKLSETPETNPLKLTGTLTDTETKVEKTFELELSFKTPASSVENSTVKINDDNTKVQVSVTGQQLPTSIGKWEITEKSTTEGGEERNSTQETATWSIATEPAASNTTVTFEVDYKNNVFGKTFVFKIKNSSTTFEVNLPSPTLTNAESSIEEEGNLVVTLTGNNLPNNKDLYTFEQKTTSEGAPSRDDSASGSATTPTVSNFELKDNTATFTFNKLDNNNNNVLTKGLYGKNYLIKLNDQSTEFTFASYSGPTGIDKNTFFDIDDQDSSSIVLELTTEQFGNNTEFGSSLINASNNINLTDEEGVLKVVTITTSAQDKTHVAVNLKNSIENNTNAELSSLFEGLKGFSKSGNKTKLSWTEKNQQTIDDEDNSNADYRITDNLIETVAPLSGNKSIEVIMTGTLIDEYTNESVSFDLKFVFKLAASSDSTK